MALSRRRFLSHGMTVVAAGVALPPWLQGLARAEDLPVTAPSSDTAPILVVLQFSGGNDGLNTVIPYADTLYRENRPQIGIPENQVIHLDNDIGLHPNLTGMKGLFDRGKVAVIQNAGYPNPNRSHFRSMEIWHTAAPDRVERYGWIGRYLDGNPALAASDLAAVNVGVEAPRAIDAEKAAVLTVDNVDNFGVISTHAYSSKAENPAELLEEIEKAGGAGLASQSATSLVRETTLDAFDAAAKIRNGVKKYRSDIVYPTLNPVANGFKQVAKLLAAGLGTRVFYVSTGGFDTHAREKDQHDLLMRNVDNAIDAFYRDLEGMGLADRVMIMTFSEFGRRVQENAGGGTDHGTAGPMFLIGGKVKGGVYGEHPNLANLDQGDLKFGVDFRSVYATVLDRWLGADSGHILGGDFPHVPALV